MSRFRDPGFSIYAFDTYALVRCPKCSRRARADDDGVTLGSVAKVVCVFCGYAAQHGPELPEPRSTHKFGLPLWLQTPCCGEILWAYNADHLAWMERFVSATLREDALGRSPMDFRNKTLPSRLPAWIKSRKNRDEVLKGLARLRAMLT